MSSSAKKGREIILGAFQYNKNPEWHLSPPGVKFCVNLALTNRMDASKAKKEASKIKISFCGVIYFHGLFPLTTRSSIHKFLAV
jgi:hypothetical protein